MHFRDFSYCDSGMIPWLLIVELMGKTRKKLSELIKERKEKFPSSGEINFTMSQPKKIFERYVSHWFIRR